MAVSDGPHSYEEWLATLPGCEECGQVDPLDYIEGRPVCAACDLDAMGDDEEDDEWP